MLPILATALLVLVVLSFQRALARRDRELDGLRQELERLSREVERIRGPAVRLEDRDGRVLMEDVETGEGGAK